ncbi:MAG: MFS transporter [Polyangiaceae bacterium]
MSQRAPVLTRAFAMAWLASFAHGLAEHSYVHFSGFLEQLGASSVVVGWAFSALAIAALASRPFFGRLMDQRGRRVLILIGGVVHVIACTTYLAIDRIGVWVYLARGLHGIAEGMLFSALFTFAADIVPEERRTEGIALFGVSGLLPIAAAGALGDVIVLHWGYRALFLFTIAAAVGGLLLSLPLRDIAVDGNAEAPRGFMATVREPLLLPVWLVGIATATSLAAVFVFLKTYMLWAKSGQVGIFFGAFSFAAVMLRVTLGWLPDRIGALRTLYPAAVVLVLGLILLALDASTPSLIASGMLVGIGHGFVFPILAGLVVSRARPRERGAAMTIFTALFHVGILIGGPCFGTIIDLAGYRVAYFTAGGMIVLGMVLFAWLDARRELARAPG